MTFTSPIWFIALAPWAALLLWLLSGRLEKSGVPFLNLWPSHSPQWPKPKRHWEKPPFSLAALLAAMFLAILAAAGPLMSHRKSPALTVIVDRGLGSRFALAAKELDVSLRRSFPDANVDLRIVPSADSTTGQDWLSRVLSLQPTAAEDAEPLTLECRQALRQSAGPVILLSDRAIQLSDPRLVQFASSAPITNVGIDLLSVRASPATQAMVRLFNQSGLTSAELIVRADGNIVQSRQIALPPSGGKRDYFVDIPAAPTIVEAQVQCDDSIQINHRAWAVRGAAWPIVEPGSSLPPELTRMIEVYGRHRLPSQDSQRIAVVNASDSIPFGVPVAILADEAAGGTRLSTARPLIVTDDLLKIQSVEWSSILAGATVWAAPGKDWQAIVSAGGAAIVAVRDAPVRQAWIGFRADGFARRPDFVVFWSAIFDWLGGAGSPDYTSGKVGPLAGNWRLQEPPGLSLSAEDAGLVPGLYKSGDGKLVAVNASAPPISPPSPGDGPGKLKALAALHNQNAPLAGATLLGAMGLIGLSAATWRAPIPGQGKAFQS
ncbi:MAG: hypothetical protein ABSB74_05105 [Tepidisphaeraceae bacterium]